MNEKFYNLVLQGKMTWEDLQKMLIQFNTAMANAQATIETIEEGDKALHGPFAGWPTIRSKTKDAIAKDNGLVVEQYHTGEPDNMRLITIIKHNASGYEEVYESPLVFNRGTSRGGKLEHEVQAAITYYKRNTYNGLFCIATNAEDSETAKPEQTKSVQTKGDIPQCPFCYSPMKLVNGKSGQFWGCSMYPTTKCQGSRKFTETS